MEEVKEFLKIKVNNKNNRSVKGCLRTVEFEDNGHFVIYIPSLQLSAYGDDITEAKEMLEVVVDDFCDSLTELSEGQALAELRKFGWEKNSYFTKRFENSNTYIDREGILKDFDLPSDTKVREKFLAV